MEPRQDTDHNGKQDQRPAPQRHQAEVTRSQAAPRSIRCDVYENDKEFLVLAEVPGMDRESCDISVHDRELRIRASRGDGELTRTFTLPHNADPNQIKASARDGVLRIAIEKTRESQPRRIQIEG